MELRVALTVLNFDEAATLYRDALGLEQLADWGGRNARLRAPDGKRLTLFSES